MVHYGFIIGLGFIYSMNHHNVPYMKDLTKSLYHRCTTLRRAQELLQTTLMRTASKTVIHSFKRCLLINLKIEF